MPCRAVVAPLSVGDVHASLLVPLSGNTLTFRSSQTPVLGNDTIIPSGHRCHIAIWVSRWRVSKNIHEIFASVSSKLMQLVSPTKEVSYNMWRRCIRNRARYDIDDISVVLILYDNIT